MHGVQDQEEFDQQLLADSAIALMVVAPEEADMCIQLVQAIAGEAIGMANQVPTPFGVAIHLSNTS